MTANSQPLKADDRECSIFSFFMHHKGGSSWAVAVLSELATSLRMPLKSLTVPDEFPQGLPAALSSKPVLFVYRNAEFPHVRTVLPKVRGVHIIRDPRDIVVSAYYSHRNSHQTDIWPELPQQREKLTGLSVEDGLIQTVNFLEQLPTRGHDLRLFKSLAEWEYNHPTIKEVKFENVIRDPQAEWTSILQFLGLWSDNTSSGWPFGIGRSARQIDSKILTRALQKFSFKTLSGGRTEGKEDQTSHYRKGRAGDWIEHFTPRVKDHFKNVTGDLVFKLGYEIDSSW